MAEPKKRKSKSKAGVSKKAQSETTAEDKVAKVEVTEVQVDESEVTQVQVDDDKVAEVEVTQVKVIIVKSKSKLGFRRAGFRFSQEPRCITLELLSDTQIEALKEEAELVCEFATIEKSVVEQA